MSTPIETNTEELQEVLQQVYDLPSRSDGGDSYDLVVLMEIESGYYESSSINSSVFSVKSGSVSNTFNKLLNREKANVVVEFHYYYGGSDYTGVFHPVSVCADIYKRNDVVEGQYVCLDFYGNYSPGFSGYITRVSLRLNIDGTVSNVGAVDISET